MGPDRQGRVPHVDTINVLGVKVSALNLDTAATCIQAAVDEGRRGYVCVAGAHGIVESQSDADLRAVFNGAFLVTPDGMPLVWELRRSGHETAGRVYGPDLMLEMVVRGQSRGLRHYLYGATDETLEKLRAGLLEHAPEAQIVGSYAPPFRPLTNEEEADVAARLNEARADIVWVGISCPKQERWMAQMRDRLEAPVLVGVGAAFDFHAGNTVQAPDWVQQAGLEWAFRLKTEPRRLWKRYLRIVPTYLFLLAAERMGLRRRPQPGYEVGS
ncbi:N-acetylglucosaminyldiphosphoundecaprenol N-acetyl-beta-D-mannosaminyltransferase [Tropicimonas isoalkanivorans]|uniref:N-acetylglucosaminyldiphosphoundecaprenol N-acetyl-beta-D-mannosaminyltransferase n=1 Tax=Tropicimonas isoalkanivorans TaxID=441112 RepID=A0A1I1R996_9RHOB|nr:N-acetylglucosaminyldiphosphoundecaprenol N-acetyl-beta-D-mannosaminyltransferase [Tropicimonas isoalkanivorans]